MAEHRRHETFVVCAPDGMFYWPPVSIDEARQTITERSLYVGEPGWEMIPTWLAIDSESGGLRHPREIH